MPFVYMQFQCKWADVLVSNIGYVSMYQNDEFYLIAEKIYLLINLFINLSTP